MLILSPSEGRYRDDDDPKRLWVAPSSLEPRVTADGEPTVSLAVGEEGGLLNLALRAVAVLEGGDERAVPLSGGRFRLVVRTPMGEEHGGWYDSGASGDTAVSRSVSLDPAETALAARSIEGGDGVVDVEVELVVRGRRPAWPWIVAGDTSRIRGLLEASLGSDPVEELEIARAVTGLGRDAFRWTPTIPSALPPPEAAALSRVAEALQPLLFESIDGAWGLRADPPERLRVSLEVPLAGRDVVGLRWSFSDFLAGVDDPTRHIVRVATPAPFQPAHLHVVNDVPLHADGISRVVVEARTGGPSGVLGTEFVPGGATSQRIGFVRESHEALDLRWRARSTFKVRGRPTTHQTEWRAGGLLAEIDVGALELAPIRVAVEPAVFAEAVRLEVRIGRGSLTLDPDGPERWVTGRPPAPERASVEMVLPDGRRSAPVELPIPPTGLVIRSVDLGFGRMAEVELSAPDDLDVRAAYLAVQPDDGPWRTLARGESITWSVPCPTGAHEPVLGYRTLHVPRTESGGTGRIVESERREVSGTHAVVQV